MEFQRIGRRQLDRDSRVSKLLHKLDILLN